MKIFAYIGIFVSALSVTGMLGYGPEPVVCKATT